MSWRAVFLTHEPPYPPISGARVRTWHLMSALRDRGWRLSLFSLLAEDAEREQSQDRLRELCDDVVLCVLPSARTARAARIAGALARREAFQSRYFMSAPAAEALHDSGMLRAADAIVVSLLYMYPYLPGEFRHRALLDTHNSEVARLESMVRAAPRSPRGLVAHAQRRVVLEHERTAVRRVARTLAVSESERRWFESIAPGRVDLVPNGVDCAALTPREALPAELSALFLGNLGYGPNQDGVRWLLRDVLPRVGRRDFGLTVAGGGAPGSLRRLAARSRHAVTVTGFVPDTGPCFARARLLVVPLRIGGGTRLKILEALARGVPVVSTSLGCEGLDLRHGRELLVADGPEAFAAAVERLLEDDDLCRELSARGAEAVRERYDWGPIGEAFARSLAQVAEARPVAGEPV